MEIIPDIVLTYLPFSPEPVSQWDDKTDLLEFLYALYDHETISLMEDGNTYRVNMRWWGKGVFEMEREEFQSWIKKFDTAARDSILRPEEAGPGVVIPDFCNDPRFGKAAKHYIGYWRSAFRTLEDGIFFSIAHVQESVDDLKCSVELAAQLYYKQSHQVLRNFLEDLILPIHFCDSPQEYLNWKNNSYRVPPLRGKDGLLKKLADKDILPDQLTDEVSSLYGDLNAFVHGSESRLINKGNYTRNWMGRVYKDDEFNLWCDYLSRSSVVGIQLLKINLDQWESLRVRHKIVCTICHNNDNKAFDSETFSFGEELTKYTCKHCGNEITLNSEWTRMYKVTQGDTFSYHG
jgi:hypothetical protein